MPYESAGIAWHPVTSNATQTHARPNVVTEVLTTPERLFTSVGGPRRTGAFLARNSALRYASVWSDVARVLGVRPPGRNMKRYLVQTFGCQMNVHDSERMEEVLHDSGYVPTDEPSLADVIVVNTCSIREKAEHKLLSLLGTFRPLKAQRPDMVLAVAGCVAQQEGEALLKRLGFVDLVLGPDNIGELPALLRRLEGGEPPIARTVHDLDEPQFLVARPSADGHKVTAYVTTMKGCDERCTYCIVPYTRGAERYRPADEIVRECAALAESGVREITLLGQTVNSWYEPGLKPVSKLAPSDSGFAGLIRRIAAEAPSLLRIRYTSPHPRHLTPELIRAHAEVSALSTHLHLPVQSGSDRLLRRMARRYTSAEYLERVRALREAVPGISLSTDIIVGFPGETDEDFEDTLSLVRAAGFVAAFGFKYSPRPHTPALALGDDVPESVKDVRLARLFALVGEQQQAHLDALVGTTQRVLIEGPSRGEALNRYAGRTERHEIVHLDVEAGVDPTGHLVSVEITQAYKHSLRGVMTSDVLPAMRAVRPKPRRGLVVLSDAASG